MGATKSKPIPYLQNFFSNSFMNITLKTQKNVICGLNMHPTKTPPKNKMSDPIISFENFTGTMKAKIWQIDQYISASLRLAPLQKTTDGVKIKKSGSTLALDEAPGEK